MLYEFFYNWITSQLDILQRAQHHVYMEPRQYFSQLQACQTLPADAEIVVSG